MNRLFVRLALASAFATASLLGAAGAAQAVPQDYVMIELIELRCHVSSEDHDEAYLKADPPSSGPVQVWPGSVSYHKMGPGFVKVLDDITRANALLMDRNESIQLKLWDYDVSSPDDQLGAVTVHGSEVGAAPLPHDLIGSGGHYTIVYRVIDV
jgi:hypothetical protein